METIIENSPETIAQLFSAFDLFIKDKLKDIFIDEEEIKSIQLFLANTVHLDLKIKKDSIEESSVTEMLFSFFEQHGFYCELVKKDIPHWEVFHFLKNGKKLGTFNSDIYPFDDHDKLLITITPKFD